MRNLQEQVKKAFCYQKLFWPFTVWTNCSSDLNFFVNSRPSASNFKIFSRSLEQFFLTVGQNNFGYKIPLILLTSGKKEELVFKALTARILTATTNKFSVYAVALLSSKAFSDCRRFVSVAPFAPFTELNERQKNNITCSCSTVHRGWKGIFDSFSKMIFK